MPLTGNLHFHSAKDSKVLAEFESQAKNHKKDPPFFNHWDLFFSLLFLAVALFITFSSQEFLYRELGKALSVFAILNLFRSLLSHSSFTKGNDYENHAKNENDKADSGSV